MQSDHKTLMEFLAEGTENGLRIPRAALELSGFGPREAVDYFTEKDVIVTLKRRMTAMELVNAAIALCALSEKLIRHLADVCGECGNCEDCVCGALEEDGFSISEELRDGAGIPAGRRLKADVDAGEKRIIITEAGYDNDLRDIPEDILEGLVALGAALCELDQHIRKGDVVYGGD